MKFNGRVRRGGGYTEERKRETERELERDKSAGNTPLKRKKDEEKKNPQKEHSRSFRIVKEKNDQN